MSAKGLSNFLTKEQGARGVTVQSALQLIRKFEPRKSEAIEAMSFCGTIASINSHSDCAIDAIFVFFFFVCSEQVLRPWWIHLCLQFTKKNIIEWIKIWASRYLTTTSHLHTTRKLRNDPFTWLNLVMNQFIYSVIWLVISWPVKAASKLTSPYWRRDAAVSNVSIHLFLIIL